MTAMVSGLDDGDEPHSLVALEAMVGLARLLDLVEPWDLRLVLLHTTIRIRPFFDSVSCRALAGLSSPSVRSYSRYQVHPAGVLSFKMYAYIRYCFAWPGSPAPVIRSSVSASNLLYSLLHTHPHKPLSNP